MNKIEAFASLGSNSENAPEMLARARTAINNLPGVEITACSPLYRTEPQGYKAQPWFHNQVIKLDVEASMRPQVLLKNMLEIETALGRKRGPLRFGPRCIDIDLLLFGNENIEDPQCSLPHPRMAMRAFVLAPLLDIAPAIKLGGQTLPELLAKLPWRKEGLDIYQD